jgi:1-acyl-sn-glycerol-3-phosphate acyltransferase
MEDTSSLKELKLAEKTAKRLLPVLEKYFRVKWKGLDNIPTTSFLGVGNHLGVHFMPESFLWVGKCHTLDHVPAMKVLVHRVLHDASTILKLPKKEFGILNASHKNAVEALSTGHAVTVYPGGDRENSKPFKDRHKIDFYEHTGYIKLALRAQVPILPVVGIGGGETAIVLSSGEKFAKKTGLTDLFKLHTWPIYWSFPGGWHIGHFPHLSLPLPAQITMSVLPPISTASYSPEDAEDPEILAKLNTEIVTLMQKELSRMAKGRIPIIGKLGK